MRQISKDVDARHKAGHDVWGRLLGEKAPCRE